MGNRLLHGELWLFGLGGLFGTFYFVLGFSEKVDASQYDYNAMVFLDQKK